MVQTLADKAREMTRNALALHLRHHDWGRDSAGDHDQTLVQAEAEARDLIFPRIKVEIVARAASGNRTYTETLLRWWVYGDHPATQAKVAVLTPLLEAEGFEVWAYGDGYDKFLRVSW